MGASAARVLTWAPRVLGLLLAAFVAVFAADVFRETHGFLATIGALVIHLVPSLLVLGAVAIGWRWDGVGALLFGGLAVFYVALASRHLPPRAWVGIAAPLALVAVLFLLSWLHRVRSRSR